MPIRDGLYANLDVGEPDELNMILMEGLCWWPEDFHDSEDLAFLMAGSKDWGWPYESKQGTMPKCFRLPIEFLNNDEGEVK